MRNVAIAGAWLGALPVLIWLWGPRPTPAMGWTVLIATFVVGLIVERWWLVALPVLAAFVATVVLILAPPACPGGCVDESGAGSIALFLYIATTALTVALALGVGARKFARIARGELQLERAAEGTYFGMRWPPRRSSRRSPDQHA
jgi:hypothetical protein